MSAGLSPAGQVLYILSALRHQGMLTVREKNLLKGAGPRAGLANECPRPCAHPRVAGFMCAQACCCGETTVSSLRRRHSQAGGRHQGSNKRATCFMSLLVCMLR